MSSPQIAVWFTREDYPAVKRLSPHDPELPDSFDKWLNQEMKRAAKVEACGIPVRRVIVYSWEIAVYCRRCGCDADDAIRGAIAVVKAHQKVTA
jgi:hypothetical protein